MGDDTKQMQGHRLIGIGLQYLLVNAFGLRQSTRIVMLHSAIYSLLDG